MVALWLCAGGITGVLSGLSLRWTVGFLRPGATGRAVILTMAGVLLRWVLTASLLVAALQRGAAAALLAFFGLWLARWGMVYWELTYGRFLSPSSVHRSRHSRT